MNCHSCGTALSDSAKFCHKCGAAVGAPAARGSTADWRAGVPWALAGLALGALVAVLVLRDGSGGGGAGAGAAMPPAGGGGQSSMDISQMSTEEMARRLFDRVMRLSEEGKQDSVAFFQPMALQTYAQLPAHDNDARYDIGLLHLAGGNPQGALAQADTLLAAVPTHLYAFILRARAYDALGDGPNARRAYAAFVQHEAAERARGRPEYQAHATTLDAFQPEAAGRARGTP
jgi:hypothetical protein